MEMCLQMAMYGFLVKLNGKDSAVSTGIIPEGDRSQHKGLSKVGQPVQQKDGSFSG